ncbi:MAG TPA: DUF4255 domain-containing protein [Chloroflexota bacterium]|nr:DUF4255 domain-containing protein [Chloroflexota bacterium]
MLADLDETIRHFLIDYAPLDTTEIDISFETPDREWSSRLSRPTVNCFLYELRENHDLRQTGFDVTRENGAYVRKKEPIRIDATYQVSVWAQGAEDEHQLLWHVLATLARHPVIPEDTWEGVVREQPLALQTRVAQPDEGPRNMAELWQSIDNRVRPTITYTLTVALDPNVSTGGPLVLRRRFGYSQIDPPAKLPDAVNPEIVNPQYSGRRLTAPPDPALAPASATTSMAAPAPARAPAAKAVKPAQRRNRPRPAS